MSQPNTIGQITWHDYTMKDASALRDFYSKVVGWTTSEIPMKDASGAYADYCMHAAGEDGKQGEVVAGICHARGPNTKIPPQWMMYITVADAEASAKKCVELGGKLLDGPRKMGNQTFCFIQDPAGAVCGLASTKEA
ncbi:MAG: VOC family protein [Phycisphaerae bacterium]|nr:VOC family protein [Phycisphaerae bacterium]